jgi:hypothetical protein
MGFGLGNNFEDPLEDAQVDAYASRTYADKLKKAGDALADAAGKVGARAFDEGDTEDFYAALRAWQKLSRKGY